VQRRPIRPEDRLWLELERPSNLMTITSVLWTSAPVHAGRLRSLLHERLVERYPAFRQRPVAGLLPGSCWWADDPDFDLDRHLRVEALAPPGDRAALEAFVAARRGEPLDRAHPLWSVDLLQGYGEGSAVVQRYHHAIADGVRLTRVGLGLLDPLDGHDRAPAARVGRTRPVHAGAHLSTLAGRFARAAGGGPVLDLASTAGSVLPAALRPDRLLDLTSDAALAVLHTAGSVVKIASWSNPHTALDGEPGTDKTAAWGDPVPLPVLRGIAGATGSTVADVCAALVAGAVTRYLAERADRQPSAVPQDLAWMIPVNLEPYDAGPPTRLGNHFALVLAVLPHRDMRFRDRVALVHERMARIRDSWEPALTFGIARGIAMTPGPLATALGDSLAAKAVGVLTNVPGPRAPMALAGAPVGGMVAWAPCSARQALTVCVISYAGAVSVGFGTDRRVVPDPGRLVAAFDAELAEAAGAPTAARS
jgi:diacylglycerol O-acyltransferase